MRARQVMSRLVHTVPADASVYDAAQVLLNAGISATPVVDADGKMIGIVSEADLMYRTEIGTVPGKSWLQRLLAEDVVMARDYIRSHSHRVADVMTKNVVTAEERTSLATSPRSCSAIASSAFPPARRPACWHRQPRQSPAGSACARALAFGDVAADDKLRNAVVAELARQGWASPRSTNVVAETARSIFGDMSTTRVRDAYRTAAENVRGVKRVENHMNIMPPEVRFGI